MRRCSERAPTGDTRRMRRPVATGLLLATEEVLCDLQCLYLEADHGCHVECTPPVHRPRFVDAGSGAEFQLRARSRVAHVGWRCCRPPAAATAPNSKRRPPNVKLPSRSGRPTRPRWTLPFDCGIGGADGCERQPSNRVVLHVAMLDATKAPGRRGPQPSGGIVAERGESSSGPDDVKHSPRNSSIGCSTGSPKTMPTLRCESAPRSSRRHESLRSRPTAGENTPTTSQSCWRPRSSTGPRIAGSSVGELVEPPGLVEAFEGVFASVVEPGLATEQHVSDRGGHIDGVAGCALFDSGREIHCDSRDVLVGSDLDLTGMDPGPNSESGLVEFGAQDRDKIRAPRGGTRSGRADRHPCF